MVPFETKNSMLKRSHSVFYMSEYQKNPFANNRMFRPKTAILPISGPFDDRVVQKTSRFLHVCDNDDDDDDPA